MRAWLMWGSLVGLLWLGCSDSESNSKGSGGAQDAGSSGEVGDSGSSGSSDPAGGASGKVDAGGGEASSGEAAVATGGSGDAGGRASGGDEGSGGAGASGLVPGGPTKRGNDDAEISSYRLDTYEVTVARFRAFAADWDAGYRPGSGDGTHAHLPNGLSNLAATGGELEQGWDLAWASKVDTSATARQTSGTPHPTATWTATPGPNEDRPINFINWYEAYAFCIWDGGFLPSELERQYAAQGGSDYRKYPWGETEPAADSVLAVYGCLYGGGGGLCSSVATMAPVGSAPAGRGKWGHADLAGNIAEWTLDEYDGLLSGCSDCAWLPGTSTNRHVRGGSFAQAPSYLVSTNRVAVVPDTRYDYIGVRCAREP